MTLTTHAVVGAAAASFFPQSPALAFAAGFASHFLIDALPHWDYELRSKKDKTLHGTLNDDMDVRSGAFLFDCMRVGGDALFGTALSIFIFSFWLFNLPLWLVVLGAWAGILPDPLQFLYYKTRLKLLEPLQRFHIWIQKGRSIYPPPLLGIFYQTLLAVLVLGAAVFL